MNLHAYPFFKWLNLNVGLFWHSVIDQSDITINNYIFIESKVLWTDMKSGWSFIVAEIVLYLSQMLIFDVRA